jgi:HAE1 family hydrophobic/amphiphilic exporter-1
MNIARFAVTHPVAVTMRVAALVLLGAICLTRLPIDLLPKVSIPIVAVVTQWPNVAPEEIEAQVTRPIEQAVSSTPNLYQVSSSTVEGSSTVRVQFNWGTDIGQATVDVLQLVERARQRFPTDPTLQTPIVFKYDPSQLPILIYGVSGEEDPVKLRTLMDNQVSPLIESANGVASAVVTGGEQRAVIVDVDPSRLRSYHLSLDGIIRRINLENLNLPAGIAKQSDTEYTIRSLGWFNSPQEMARIPVGAFNGQIVSLSDVASVRDDHPETRLYTRLNGKPAVGLIITKQSGANTVETAQAVDEKIRHVSQLYPNLRFGLAYDQSQFIRDSISNVRDSALIGGALAILLLLFFLRNFRSTFVVALSIPISIISTFALLYMCGFTLNTMSLSGLALATGLIVDDAVVVLENIFRHIERDKKRAAEAAVTGTNEISSAVIASTLTIIVVFLPLLLIKGQAGQMFTQFAMVVIFSIAVSLLDAMTVVPMLASRLIQGEAHHENLEDGHQRNGIERLFFWFGKKFNAIDEAYRRGLSWAIHHRFWIIGGAALISASSFLLVPYMGTELMPKTDSGDFTVIVKLPVGTSLAKTDATMHQVEQILLNNPNVNTVFAAAGTTLSLRGSTTALTPYQGSATVKLKENRTASTEMVMNDLRREFGRLAGARTLVNPYDIITFILTGGPQNVEVDIFGEDLAQLAQISKDVMARVRTIPGLENVDVNWQEATPELQWKVDRDKALQFGISFSDIANTLNTATNGTISSYYQELGFQYPIIVQLPEAERKTVASLMNMSVSPSTIGGAGVTGRDIQLRQVAQPKYAVGPSEITRIDRQRYIAITGLPQGRSESEIQADIQKAMQSTALPTGYYWDWGTNQKRRADEFAGMGLAVVLAIGLIYMLLASQFESFVHPLTVLFSVPLSAVGVILSLFLTGRAFGLTAFIGLLMLVGIVVKNGILLVDYTNVLRGRGIKRDDAVLTAGPTRLRPILMTTCAAVLGMLPLAMGIGKGSETQAPMATAVIGGLITSTLLTLFVVPTVYTIFDDIARFFRKDDLDLAHAEIVEPTLEAIEREPHTGEDPPSLPAAPASDQNSE